MRDVLFRGKRVDNSEWVEGDLLQYTDGTMSILPSNRSLGIMPYMVIPKTVGQYTGLKDKNGKALNWWEDDLLRDGENIKRIIFKNGAFYLQWVKHPEHKVLLSSVLDWADDLEKVGNAHANPELLAEVNNGQDKISIS